MYIVYGFFKAMMLCSSLLGIGIMVARGEYDYIFFPTAVLVWCLYLMTRKRYDSEDWRQGSLWGDDLSTTHYAYTSHANPTAAQNGWKKEEKHSYKGMADKLKKKRIHTITIQKTKEGNGQEGTRNILLKQGDYAKGEERGGSAEVLCNS